MCITKNWSPKKSGYASLVSGRKCMNCGNTDSTILELDHFIPESKGGANSEENFNLLCGRCNKAKGDMMPEVFYTAAKYEKIKNALSAKFTQHEVCMELVELVKNEKAYAAAADLEISEATKRLLTVYGWFASYRELC